MQVTIKRRKNIVVWTREGSLPGSDYIVKARGISIVKGVKTRDFDKFFLVFTLRLHVMQRTVYNQEKAVCPSVCPSVCQTRRL